MEDRLLYPTKNGERISWDSATRQIADKFSDVIEKHGPNSVAFYVSGQFLTEDYYVANKLMKGYIGSGNIDTNSRLCMASSVVGHKRAFGADIVPGCYEDLEQADLLILTGSNLAWCHPIIYKRIEAAKTARPDMKVVVIDPRETATCDIADMHLPLAPGSDVPLFQGLFKYLEDNGCADKTFIDTRTEFYPEAKKAARAYDLKRVADATGLTREDLTAFYSLYGDTAKTVTVYSQGVNQARDGSDKVNAIINCHLLTGRIGKNGAGPFSVTGQPNAMGGREVGGLANQLASHLDIENPKHRDLLQRFWNSPKMAEKAGLKAVDLFAAIHAGTVKAVWIMATNPVDSMPDADFVKAALDKCEMVVVSDIYAHTDTVACADIVLPATGWGEKDGMVTNSERRMSRQRAFLPAPGEARHDWQALCGVAKHMGFDGFDFNKSAEIHREYAALSAFENNIKEGTLRALNLSGFATISDEEFEVLKPVQWPLTDAHPNGMTRLFEEGQYFTPNRKARFVAPENNLMIGGTSKFPFILNSGRIRDHWHTMTRTGRSSRLSAHIAEPYVEIHPKDSQSLGLDDADIAQIRTQQGTMLARVLVTKRQRPGSLFVPMHFTHQVSCAGRVGALVKPDVDPVSGQPAFKSSAASVEKFKAQWYGFAAVSSQAFDACTVPAAAQYWAKARTHNGMRIELAGLEGPESLQDFMRSLLGDDNIDLEILELSDISKNQNRLACFDGAKLVGLLYTDQNPVAVSRDWACRQLLTEPKAGSRHRLLAGRPGSDMPDKGAIICACENIGVNEINCAIQKGCSTIAQIGDATRAGTNCGSCQSELRSILQKVKLAHAV